MIANTCPFNYYYENKQPVTKHTNAALTSKSKLLNLFQICPDFLPNYSWRGFDCVFQVCTSAMMSAVGGR